MRWWRTGNPETKLKKIRGTAFQRFNSMHTKIKGGCWEWQGRLDKRGYGRLVDDAGWRDMAHRWSYKYFVGQIPKGLVIHHKCMNPKCVNPKHLEPVTYKQNTIDKGVTNVAYLNSQKTHCIHGHELSKDNIYLSKGKYGHIRVCKVCHKKRVNKYLSKTHSV